MDTSLIVVYEDGCIVIYWESCIVVYRTGIIVVYTNGYEAVYMEGGIVYTLVDTLSMVFRGQKIKNRKIGHFH